MNKSLIGPADSACQKVIDPPLPRMVVLGSGEVGLAVSVGFAERGHHVVVIEPEAEKRVELEKGESLPDEKILVDAYEKALSERLIEVSADISEIGGASYVFLCVDGYREEFWDLVKRVSSHVTNESCLIIACTVPIGTGDRLQNTLREQGKEIEVISYPPFLTPGSSLADFRNPSRIIIGGEESQRGIHSLRRLLSRDVLPIMITSRSEAEMIKYATSTFLATKVSFMNQLAWICQEVGTDVVTVARALGLEPGIGQSFLQPGIDFGVSLLAKELSDLMEQGRRLAVELPLLEAVEQIHVIQRSWVLNQLKKRYSSLKGKNLAVWGIRGKGDSRNIEESTAFHIFEQLLALQAHLRVYDPTGLADLRAKIGNSYADQVKWCVSSLESVDQADALLILTDWQEFVEVELGELKNRLQTPLIIDGRNLFPLAMMNDWGFEYVSVGRKV